MALSSGDPAPDVVLVDHAGSTWRLRDHRGHPVVLLYSRDLA
ncbi:MAG TPA: hypothetical protein VHN98_03960 [Acidimicrobiales bacterium]|nr:hypothetical protein [Acidimicrobiales bacterium]